MAERAELGQPPEILFGSYLHLHCKRLLGTAQFAERNVMDLLRRTRESLAKAPALFSVPKRRGIVPDPDRSKVPRAGRRTRTENVNWKCSRKIMLGFAQREIMPSRGGQDAWRQLKLH